MRQAYELGKILHEQYVNKYNLLPKHYDANIMRVRASQSDRTMITAHSILLGLYSLGTGPSLQDGTKALPGGFQPIPILTVPREQDALLVPTHDKIAAYMKLLKEYVFSAPEWITKDKELKPYYAAWSKIYGKKINNLFELLYFYDKLFVENIYNLPLPNGLSQKEADLILKAGKWAFLKIANNSQLSRVAGKELAQTINRALNSATEENHKLKYLLLVAHDTTLEVQLKLLNQTIDDIPPYASRLNYSLYDMGSANYAVRVTFNNEPVYIDACGGVVCGLHKFSNIVK